jgi:hypothetical protein
MLSALPAETYDIMKDYSAPSNDRWRLRDPPSVHLIDQSLHDTLGQLQTKITFVKDNTSLVPPEKISSLTANILSSARQLDHMVVKSGLIFPRVACFKKFNDSLNDTLGELEEKICFLKDNTSLVLLGKISSLTEEVSSLIMQTRSYGRRIRTKHSSRCWLHGLTLGTTAANLAV